MATQGTPIEGLNRIAALVFTPVKTLVAYCNPSGSLGAGSVAADLQQPDESNGYAPIALTGTWSFANGIASYQHSPGASNDGLGNPCWIASGPWSAPVTGVAMLDGTILQHFVDRLDPDTAASDPFTAAAGKKLVADISQLQQ